MMDEADEVRDLFKEAVELKDVARKSVDHIDHYLKAAERLEAAASLSEYLAKKCELDHDLRTQHEVFSLYYSYEEHDSLSGYHYEKRDTEVAKEHIRVGKQYLGDAIAIIESLPEGVSLEVKQHLTSFLPNWKHFQREIEIKELANDARAAWDSGRFIDALDRYRRMASRQKEIIDHPQIDGLDPAYRRIAIGNFIGYMKNSSSAMAEIILSSATKGMEGDRHRIPLDLLVKLLRYTLDACRLGNAAFEQNPEWDQYHKGAQHCLNNIQQTLKLNFPLWLQLYIIFESDTDFLTAMKMTDLKKFKEIERQRHLTESKLLKLWGVGSFWLFMLGSVAALVLWILSYEFAWWQLLLVIGTIETILIIIGALTLRTIGDLSQENFLALINVALRYQFRVFTITRKSDVTDDNSPSKTIKSV